MCPVKFMKFNIMSRHQNIPNPASYRAFTLVELVVVIAILALLAAMSLPALCKTNIKSNGLQCMSNLKMLTVAWLLYGQDNKERLIDARYWVNGNVSDSTSADFLDSNAYLPSAPLSVYLKGNVKVYKCPSDSRVSTSTVPSNRGLPVCRSVAMNNWIGLNWGFVDYTVFNKMSDFNRPGPKNTFLFVDESPKTIDDGHFIVPMDTYDPNNLPAKTWVNVPASYHSYAGNLSFVDGHVDAHKWTDDRTLTATIFTASPNNLDLDWLQSKATAKITSPTR